MMPYSMKAKKKKSEDLNKISKNEGLFFEQHPLVEKSPTSTDIYIYIHNIFIFGGIIMQI